jgi:molecular chaperone GrpE
MPSSRSEEQAAKVGDDRADSAAPQAENESLRNRLLRALADAENTRRRTERVVEQVRQYAIGDFARELLVVADNLQRAITAAEDTTGEAIGDRSLIEGVRATERILLAVLERFGIRRIEALGAVFNPELHEAVMQIEDPSRPPGTVVDVLEEGYTIHDRLLRPARVVVAKRPFDVSIFLDKPGPNDSSQ